MLERFQAMVAGTEPLPGIARKLGFVILDVQHGAVKVSFQSYQRVLEPTGDATRWSALRPLRSGDGYVVW